MDGALAYSPDGKRLAIGDHQGGLRIWDAESGKQISNLLGHSDLISDIRFMSDGNHLITSSFDTQVILWDLQQGRRELEFVHELAVAHVIVSP